MTLRQRVTAKQAAILLGFCTSLLGTLGSFLLVELLNHEIRRLSDQKTTAMREIEQLQAAASEYFLSSQQGDLVYALSLQSSARQDVVALLYKGNLLDRATPVRNVIGALAISKELDYRTTYGRYEALNDAAREQLSFDRFMAVKEFEREIIERSTKRASALFDLVSTLKQQIDRSERRLAARQRFALALSVLGATLLLYANLVVESRQSPRQAPSSQPAGAESSTPTEPREPDPKNLSG